MVLKLETEQNNTKNIPKKQKSEQTTMGIFRTLGLVIRTEKDAKKHRNP